MRCRLTLHAAATLLVTFATASLARAATLHAGPGQTYPTPCAALAAAGANDEVDVAVGTYTDSCEITKPGLTLKGVGGKPKIDLSGTNHPADYQGIYVISADNVTVSNLELTGAHVDDSNGGNAAGLRITGHGVVVHGCYIHDNQNGILAAPIVDGGTITVEYSELSHNGLGDGCDQKGCTHNVYVSKNGTAVRYDKTIFQFNWSHNLANDTVNKGHLFKSRSRETDVLYNRITGEGGHDSYEVDIPNGGLGVVVGNVIEKGPSADNSTLVNFGEEGIDNPEKSLFVAGNTLVNDFTGGTFIAVAPGATLTAHNNIFFGPGTPSSTGALSADNLSGVDPLFVDQAGQDYRLKVNSPAIGKAVAPGVAGAFSLVPEFEYVQPVSSVARATDHDLGAFEYGTNTTDAGTTATGTPDAGAGTSPADGGGATDAAGMGPAGNGPAGGGTAGSGTAGSVAGGMADASPAANHSMDAAGASSGGCGCRVAPATPGSGRWLAALAALAAAIAWRRRARCGSEMASSTDPS